MMSKTFTTFLQTKGHHFITLPFFELANRITELAKIFI